MCGIAGIVSPQLPVQERRDIASRMAATLLHRGPDDNGLWTDDACAVTLAHTRLAIQDLSPAGAQPMQSSSGRYSLVLNGEIYNFLEQKQQLQSIGHSFRGHSDTEVLLAAIEEWGLDEALVRSTGMFAFALWDAKERQLSLCRDRMGEKPLYYGWVGETFCFASELKAIKGVDPGKKLQIEPDAVAAYLRLLYVPAPLSIYKNIYKLPPGTLLTVDVEGGVRRDDFSPEVSAGTFSPQPYWNLAEVAKAGMANPMLEETAAISALDDQLRKTISRQLIADVRVGAFLSGGIDSSLVCAVAQQLAPNGIRTFTIGFDDAAHDESKHAEKIAWHLGTEHQTLHASSRDGLKVVSEMPQMFDEPFADSSQIPTHIVSKLAKEHVTVCLSGDGGDELFAGYNRYIATERIWRQTGWMPTPLRKSIGSAMLRAPRRLVGNDSRARKIAEILKCDSIEAAYSYLLSYWHDPAMNGAHISGYSEGAFDSVPTEISPFINRALFADQVGYLPGDNLCKVDRASMAVSLETRLPLLDHEIVEMSWRLPLKMKARDKTSKWLLRQVLYKYVPRQLIERPKMGFTVPLGKWLREDLRGWAEDNLKLMTLSADGYFAEQQVMQSWEQHLRCERDNSAQLWSVLMFLAWLDQNS